MQYSDVRNTDTSHHRSRNNYLTVRHEFNFVEKIKPVMISRDHLAVVKSPRVSNRNYYCIHMG